MKRKLRFNYDSDFDILYISTVPNEDALGAEEVDGIVIRRSIKTGNFVGITIFDFKERMENNDFEGIKQYIEPELLYNLNIN